MNKYIFSKSLCLCGLIFLLVFSVFAKQNVSEPKSVLGFTPGDDYRLASWSKVVDYFQKLARESDRVAFKEVGKTTEGKPFVYSVISSSKNLSKLDYYLKINNQLADPRLIKRKDKKANNLIQKGKTFVLITHGIHSTEVGSTLSSMLIAHKLASSNDANIIKILDETIVVIVPALNPDGVDIVKNWYDKTRGTDFEGTGPPELYQKYVGHDNNRDWYAFTQKETQLAIDRVHNVFHPQIVHDIHQQGQSGARFFVPPYLNPVEPNVPKEIIEGYTDIGNYVANQMRKDGLKGITTGSTYDAWTPARAYSHYHGGVRILSETASAKLASPITIDYSKMTSRRGFDINQVSANYGPLWKGGKWRMRDITNYMKTGALHLLEHAANNRQTWLNRFYKIGKDATRNRQNGELNAFVIPFPKELYKNKPSEEYFRRSHLLTVLGRAGVQAKIVKKFKVDGVTYPDSSIVIPMNQPYSGFAEAVLLKGDYPNLLDDEGNPITPYDVTAHNLSLLMGVTVKPIYKNIKYKEQKYGKGYGRGCSTGSSHRNNSVTENAIYRSHIPSKDEGWTRWVIENGKEFLNDCKTSIKQVTNKEIIKGNFAKNSIIFPDQSPKSILEGYDKDRMPKQYVGGLEGKGVTNLKSFVNNGGTLIFFNRSSDFAIEQFKLPVRNIAKIWERKDFFIPGSIVRTEIDTSHPIAEGMESQSIAWFERSPVFEVTDKSRVRIIAKYPTNPNDILLSGWALGKEKVAGKAALVEVSMGKGKIILFGFRPQYRGQSLATFPLMFNSMNR